MEKISWKDKKTDEDFTHDPRKIQRFKTQYGIENISGWVMCYSTTQHCITYNIRRKDARQKYKRKKMDSASR